MEDLFVAAGRFTRDTNGDGKIDRWFLSNVEDIAWMILRSSPHPLYKRVNDRLIWDSKRIAIAFYWANKFHKAGYSAGIGPWSSELFPQYRSEIVAYHPCGAWLGSHLRNWITPDTKGKWGVTRWPSLRPGEKPMAGNWGGSVMAIPQSSTKKDEAWKFIQFVCTNTLSQLALYDVAGVLPAYMPTWKEPIFDEKWDFFSGQSVNRLYFEIAREIPPINPTPEDKEINRIIDSELRLYIYEHQNLMSAVDNIINYNKLKIWVTN